MQQIQNKNVDMRKLSETMQYLTPRKEFVAESKQSKRETETKTKTKTQAQPQSATATPTQIQENVQASAPAQSKSETIPPCPKSLDVSPSDLLDEGEKVLKFEAFVNECLNKENKENKVAK